MRKSSLPPKSINADGTVSNWLSANVPSGVPSVFQSCGRSLDPEVAKNAFAPTWVKPETNVVAGGSS